MPPLIRTQTPQSIHSWWSDSNPVGATISIHAAAKPLMRLMYHEQARGFIKRNRGIPLSKATMEICYSYLAFKYISPKTKSLILRELDTRAGVSEEDAQAIAESFSLEWDLVAELVSSSDSQTRELADNLLRTLASCKSHALSRSFEVCTWVKAFLRVEDAGVREAALQAVAKITESPEGAQVLGDTDILAYLPSLDFSNSRFRLLTRIIVRNLTDYEVDQLKLEVNWSEADIKRRQNAIQRLSKMNNWYGGVEAVMESGALRYIPDLLNSADIETRRWTCKMLGNLPFEESKSSDIIEMGVELCAAIVSVLSDLSNDEDDQVRDDVLRALSKISHSPEGARAIGDTKFLECLPKLLHSDNGCLLTGIMDNLAFYGVLSGERRWGLYGT
ncbi:armadillo-type protein [Mycena capillaripes]|nr:armadillo-type protein [Mycena capillaripes]